MSREDDNEIIDLDYVMLSADAVAAWGEVAEQISSHILPSLGVNPKDVPDEQGRVEADGSLTIFVTLPDDKGEVGMSVPSDNWWRKQ